MAIERLDTDLEPVASAAPAEDRDLSLPPHSLQAEEAVLGSILKNPASIVRVSDFLRPEDFYQQRNRYVFRAMLSLFTDGIAIDYHSTADRLQQQGAYEASGGLLYLSELNLATPTAAHIEHYGRIVERTSIMRQLIAKAQTIAEIAYRDNLDPDTALEKAEQLILSIAEKRVTRDFRSLEDVLTEYMEQIEALQEGEATRYGIPTGYMDLDKLLGGFQRTDLIILAARTSVGKALALDTPVPTPRGWTTMGELQVGDQVFDAQGRPCTVTFATPVQYERECYEVVFSDGERIIADADHRWSVLTRSARRSVRPSRTIVTTREMRDQLRTRTGHANFSIPLAEPLQCSHLDLPLDPYVLGIWLGEGNSRAPVVTLGDAEIVDHLVAAHCEVRPRKVRGTPQFALGPWIGRGRGIPGNAKLTPVDVAAIRARLANGATGLALAREYAVSPAAVSLIRTRATWATERQAGTHAVLSQLGVLGRKHIPPAYLRASAEQRLALLQGLMDGDGSITEAGYAEFCSTSRPLADGVFELAAGLGLAPRFKEDRARLNGVDYGPRYRVCFTPTEFPVFRLARKVGRQRRIRPHARVRQRFVTAVNPVATVPVRCIQVDSPNHLYLAGRACIPTHNTSFALNLAVNAAVKHNATVAVFSLEMSAEQLASRLLSMESGVDSPRIRSAHLNEQESRKLDAAVNHLAKAPIWVDDTPSIPIMELRSKARRLAAEHTLDMIVVDYLQLVATDGGESRVQEIGQISRALKALARELRVPVLALSQLSRAVEQRTPHIPQLSDLRESGCLTGDTLIYLPDEGVQRRLDSLVGRVGFNVLALNPDTWKLERRPVINSFPTGRKCVFLLRTRSGRTIRATSYHPFYTPTGWRRLDELAPGDRIAAPRKPPGPAKPTMSGSELALLGHLIGDGCTLRKHAVQYTTVDPSLASAVTDLAREIFGELVAPRIHRERSWYQVYLPPSFHLTHRLRNPVCAWLESLGVLDLRSYEKCVPDEVFRQPDAGIARFLRHLWATDGCVRVSHPRDYAFPQLYYSTSSPPLARDVPWLLLRLGIASHIREWPQKRGRPNWHINIRSRDHIEGFLSTVGVLGRQKASAATAISSLFAERRTRTHLDTIPVAAWDRETLTRLLTSAAAFRVSAAAIGHRYSRADFRTVSLDRSATAAVASIMADDGLAALASSDVFWDEVDGIEPCGIEDVYDLTVQGLHNFVANGLIVKNSLEQDADVVLFIYRDEKYNPDTDKKGVADIIVAKHRNGPTGQVQLLFLERTTKFLDLEVYRA